MSLKAKVEAIIYATEEPVTLNELTALLKDSVLAEMRAEEAATSASDTGLSSDIEQSETSIREEGNQVVPTAATSAGAAPEIAAAATEGQARASSKKQSEDKEQLKAVTARISMIIDELTAEYVSADRGMEIRQVAGGYRMATKPEHHDVVVSFAKSLKPPVRLSLQALETLAVIAYKQPVTAP